MSDSTQTQTSQLEGYCNELHRLAVTLTGMLSQCEALGTPLGEDRGSVEQLKPVIQNLEHSIQVALAADGRMRTEARQEAEKEAEVAPAVRATGARVISWDDSAASTTPQSSEPAAQQPASQDSAVTPLPEVEDFTALLGDDPDETEGRELTATDLSKLTEEMVVLEGDGFPAIEKCAELMMSDLSAECVADIHEKGEITLQGTNESLPLPSVFQFLGQTGKTGTLRVKTSVETMRFELVGGDLVFSSSDNPPKSQLLGEILVSSNLISRESLEKMLAETSDQKRLGSALEEGKYVSHDDLRRALEQQIMNRLKRSFEAPDSAFTFSEGGSDRPHHRIRMNVTQLLLEGL